MSMSHQVDIVRVESVPTAVIRDRVPQLDLARFVPTACGEVWTFVRSAGLAKPGRHVAVYLDAKGGIEVGVEVGEPFIGNERIVCSRTPSGLAATAAHFGHYGALGEVHRAIEKWCSAHGHRPSGASWELYGHWQEEWNRNSSKIRTDVFYLFQTG